MAYSSPSGIAVSLDGTTYYNLTDHNRQPIKIVPEIIESSKRMANGLLRKYVIAKKHKTTSSWQLTTSLASNAVDGNYGGGWIKAFYEANVFNPIYVKLIYASETIPSSGVVPTESTHTSAFTSSTVYNVFMTQFDYEIVKRNLSYDLVNINIEFTEI